MELVYTADLKSAEPCLVLWVRIPPSPSIDNIGPYTDLGKGNMMLLEAKEFIDNSIDVSIFSCQEIQTCLYSI